MNTSPADHDCTFPEVEILTDDEDENLKAGMRVLLPCPTCAETPLDHMGMLDMYFKEATAILPGVDRSSGIYEVRTEHRIHKRHLWWVGTRAKS